MLFDVYSLCDNNDSLNTLSQAETLTSIAYISSNLTSSDKIMNTDAITRAKARGSDALKIMGCQTAEAGVNLGLSSYHVA